ncbi:hypothetical protein PHYBLDRAFT_61534 [Phycomyces blakesleeanus NRRL 1555(-)]|uniref:Swi5-dependent recombination DNA repair protein 1 homolog n=1 Tax=Phycomyces blakesleeanus (strain ATCC 8743b / DSM 1359 / FGSC 10004 / NBRC 33097 / NRRL 1555) TaxID=763407 RepID=A0A162V715_PHYB8|nr:hypothetical protein PHYBLDRAFT_61534 [Phycomyces blakesleeanus NRRL 1555(-)]OAD80483.1 hypothetical protein PHYBLDRAFT_61534 [Phycomyces blakesleeanus NRRL 1555(-)]|eukprot:XP_018298523.1 hypothetical protein PHYBLDRAFT_61534 [Phycomyces blakesleeanus NRRL 1555(-)]
MEKNTIKRRLPETYNSGRAIKVPSSYLNLIKQIREQDGKMETLRRAIRYKEENKLKEMGDLISRWRHIAQQLVVELQQKFSEVDNFFEEEDTKCNQDKPLKQLLQKLHIDPALVHYSEESDELLME